MKSWRSLPLSPLTRVGLAALLAGLLALDLCLFRHPELRRQRVIEWFQRVTALEVDMGSLVVDADGVAGIDRLRLAAPGQPPLLSARDVRLEFPAATTAADVTIHTLELNLPAERPLAPDRWLRPAQALPRARLRIHRLLLSGLGATALEGIGVDVTAEGLKGSSWLARGQWAGEGIDEGRFEAHWRPTQAVSWRVELAGEAAAVPPTLLPGPIARVLPGLDVRGRWQLELEGASSGPRPGRWRLLPRDCSLTLPGLHGPLQFHEGELVFDGAAGRLRGLAGHAIAGAFAIADSPRSRLDGESLDLVVAAPGLDLGPLLELLAPPLARAALWARLEGRGDLSGHVTAGPQAPLSAELLLEVLGARLAPGPEAVSLDVPRLEMSLAPGVARVVIPRLESALWSARDLELALRAEPGALSFDLMHAEALGGRWHGTGRVGAEALTVALAGDGLALQALGPGLASDSVSARGVFQALLDARLDARGGWTWAESIRFDDARWDSPLFQAMLSARPPRADAERFLERGNLRLVGVSGAPHLERCWLVAGDLRILLCGLFDPRRLELEGLVLSQPGDLPPASGADLLAAQGRGELVAFRLRGTLERPDLAIEPMVDPAALEARARSIQLDDARGFFTP